MNIEKNWLIYYKEAVLYYKENNNLNIPGTYIAKNSNIRLGSWIIRNRSLYNEGKLSIEKIKLLNDINMIWNIKEVYDNDYFNTWMTYYNEVLNYYKVNNTLSMKTNYTVINNGIKLNLQTWLTGQKTKLKNNSLGYNSKLKTKLLSDLGITNHSLQTDTKKEQNNLIWLKNYQGMLEFYKKNKTLKISNKYIHNFSDGTSINLGVWFRKQLLKYYEDKLTPKQKELLTNLGVDKLKTKKEKNTLTWMEHYELILDYTEIHNIKDMPKNYMIKYKGRNLNLGAWFYRQLSKYERETLSMKEMKLLSNLGIDSIKTKDNTITWFSYYRAILNFYNNNYNLVVPLNYTLNIDNKTIKLGKYLDDIRTNKITISNEQKEILNKVGMIWDKDEYNKKIYYNTWLNTYNAVKEYYNLYNTLLISEKVYVTINGVKVYLNEWLNLQLKLIKHNMLSSNQVDMLNEIGINKKVLKI